MDTKVHKDCTRVPSNQNKKKIDNLENGDKFREAGSRYGRLS